MTEQIMKEALDALLESRAAVELLDGDMPGLDAVQVELATLIRGLSDRGWPPERAAAAVCGKLVSMTTPATMAPITQDEVKSAGLRSMALLRLLRNANGGEITYGRLVAFAVGAGYVLSVGAKGRRAGAVPGPSAN